MAERTWKLPQRLFALAFIGIIVLGNVWVAQSAFGGKVAEWVPLTFMYLMIAAFVAGVAMTIVKIVSYFTVAPQTEVTDETSPNS